MNLEKEERTIQLFLRDWMRTRMKFTSVEDFRTEKAKAIKFETDRLYGLVLIAGKKDIKVRTVVNNKLHNFVAKDIRNLVSYLEELK